MEDESEKKDKREKEKRAHKWIVCILNSNNYSLEKVDELLERAKSVD